ncbi:MAG: AlbA family DNA-binding domain-containing protein [Phycisphaerales bacterium]
MTRDSWTFDDLPSSARSEDDRFDRKAFISGKDDDIKNFLAKALSAFANSGGGHIFLGISDDGQIGGCPRFYKSRQPTKEWIENLAISLLQPPLQEIRVHEIALPNKPDLAVIVVDVGDSRQAPHQDTRTQLYHYRIGSNSLPAPHFYLELLRNRLTRPRLAIKHQSLYPVSLYCSPDASILTCALETQIVNEGQVVAKTVLARPTGIFHKSENILFDIDTLPEGHKDAFSGPMHAPLLLPGMSVKTHYPVSLVFPFHLARLIRTSSNAIDHDMLKNQLSCTILSENGIGASRVVSLESLVEWTTLIQRANWLAPAQPTDAGGYAGWGITYEWMEVTDSSVSILVVNNTEHVYDSVGLELWSVDDIGNPINVVDLGSLYKLGCGNQVIFNQSIGHHIVNPESEWWIVVKHVWPKPHVALAGDAEFEPSGAPALRHE